jgi:hypothetical protein
VYSGLRFDAVLVYSSWNPLFSKMSEVSSII